MTKYKHWIKVKFEDITPQHICQAEFIDWSDGVTELLPILLQYIMAKKDSHIDDEIIAVGSAVRKYINNITISDRLVEIFEPPIHRNVELEIAKSIYNCFIIQPPEFNQFPRLSLHLFNASMIYMDTILERNHATIAKCMIMAIIAIRSDLSLVVLNKAKRCPYQWFRDIIDADLDILRASWSLFILDSNRKPIEWLDNLTKICR